MNIDRIIHNALKQIDWRFVTGCFRDLKLSWYNQKTPTKTALVEELTDMLYEVLESDNTQMTTNYWIINWKRDNDRFQLDIMFVPIHINLNQKTFTSRKEPKLAKLKKSLEVAIKNEDYRRAAEIKKSIDGLDITNI